MESTFSEEFKRNFLLTFTRELINHSAIIDMTKLQTIITNKENKRIDLIKAHINIQPIKREQPRIMQMPDASLLLPEPKVPIYLQNLKPTNKTLEEIDFWKITPFVKDNMVRVIEASPDEKVIVSGAVGSKTTDVTLSKEDITRIINRFSELSKIPTNEGIYRVIVGNLTLSAIISETLGSKFVIKKNILPIQ
jgi:hypothetical protein